MTVRILFRIVTMLIGFWISSPPIALAQSSDLQALESEMIAVLHDPGAEEFIRQNPDFFDEIYKGTRVATLKILERILPRGCDCIFVGIGRSPTLVIAFLQQLGFASAFNIPIKDAPSAFHEWSYERLPGRADKYLADVLKRIGPLNGKKIILIDYASTGQSLQMYQEGLIRHLRNMGSSNTVETVALYGHNFRPWKIFRPNHMIRVDGWLDLAFFDHILKLWSEFDYYFLVNRSDVFTNPPLIDDLKPRKEYETLSKWMRAKQSVDAVVKRALRRILPKPSCGAAVG